MNRREFGLLILIGYCCVALPVGVIPFLVGWDTSIWHHILVASSSSIISSLWANHERGSL